MNIRPRLLMGSFVSVKTSMSNKTKPPTHYQTLEVNSRATQGEIKSAYFKLSKQYHPDKNSSDEATAKFRDVAAAYEVLGSYETRRSYDRSILTRTRYDVRQEGAKPEDPKIKYYQSQAALFRHGTKTGSMPLYDFDAWTKAHYGKTLDRTLRAKTNAAMKREDREVSYAPQTGIKDLGFLVFAVVLVTSITLLSIQNPIDGEPALTIRQRDELYNIDQSEMKSEKSSAK